jgi:DNA primase
MQPYKDPDEFIKALGAEAYQERIDQAENSFLFEIRMLEREYDLKDPTSKTAFYNEIARRLLAFPEELERNNYIEAVAEKYQMGFDNLRKRVNNLAMQGEPERRPRPKSGIREKKKEDSIGQSQKLFLTWLIEDTRLFDAIRGLISADDFTEEPYHRVAEQLFLQYENEHAVSPARIISSFTDAGEQSAAAALFHAKVQEIESKSDREKVLKETILRIKQHSIDYRMQHAEADDLAAFRRVVEDKRALAEIGKLNISID